MCGIAGFWGEIAQTPDAHTVLARMTASLSHRGPDGEDTWLGQVAGVGHTRLAIIDLEGGNQPMWDAQSVSVIVFNGEIYNHEELRRELAAVGYAFRTRSDTEVIPAAIDHWGIESGLRRLRGMFAFAIYNNRSRRLLLARDRVGIKPLYIASVPGGLLFASEPKALLATGLLSNRANPVAVHDYLAQGYPTTPATCWADIQLMEPATWLEIGPEGVRKGTYWEWQSRENLSLDIGEATENVKSTLLDALKCHLVSDVPVGAFLSGGLDSSLIVAMLSQGPAPGMQTFSMGFGDPEYDESSYARIVARHCNTDHREARMESGEADPDLFSKILEQYDEPFGDSSCLPTYMICREMRKQVKVVLSGDGGDEVLGGYIRYWNARRLALLARFKGLGFVLNPVFGVAEHRLGRRGYQVAKAWRFSQTPREEMLCNLHMYFSEAERLALYRPEFARLALSSGATWRRFARYVPGEATDPIQQLVSAEMRLHLHADYLRKVDIASSAHGLEVRVPYLDSLMLELAERLPVRFKIGTNGNTKILARRLAAAMLPAEIAARPKQGFGIPLDRWIGKQMRQFLRSLLLDKEARINRWFSSDAVEQVWRAFEGERVAGGLSRYQRYQRVFLLSSLELWLRKWEPRVV
jgi:asparagine synthase (glutamine-hydrolysing)